MENFCVFGCTLCGNCGAMCELIEIDPLNSVLKFKINNSLLLIMWICIYYQRGQ